MTQNSDCATIDYAETLRAIDRAIEASSRGLCLPGCATGDHGECGDGGCSCQQDVCLAYRGEWYA